ncbi:MAG: TetR/AcrR family transcriptional regulator [Phenylobacterium sp.]|nr:TetR/AcrR family transcriptional regulator [Phenylobacterium sp.]
MSERPRRMTQAERTARTRARVLATAIDCLHTEGYAATTTSLVAQRSGSRGAMLHQFPTRADLMLAVVEAAFEEEMDLYDARFGAIADPKERVLAIPEAVWETLSRPAGVAVLEILQGSRSDPAMTQKLAPVLARISKESRRRLIKWFDADYLAPPAEMRLIVWAVRGLSISQVLEPEVGDVRESILLLRRLMETLYGGGKA